MEICYFPARGIVEQVSIGLYILLLLNYYYLLKKNKNEYQYIPLLAGLHRIIILTICVLHLDQKKKLNNSNDI
jgi:hypothetical protein